MGVSQDITLVNRKESEGTGRKGIEKKDKQKPLHDEKTKIV